MLPVPDNPDAELVRRTRAGEREAFLELVRRHGPAVRAIVEARIPGDPRIDAECVAAFERVHRTLFVVRELHWVHLFCVRTAQASLDERGYPPDGSAATGALGRLSLGQREALFFAERVGARAPFPAIEYLGISEDAYDARVARGRAALAAGPLPPTPVAGTLEGIVASVAERLGPAPAVRTARRLPRLPLPLAFVLACGVSALAVVLLFRPGESRARSVPAFEARALAPGAVVELWPGLELRLSPDARATHASPDRLTLVAGTLEIVDRALRPVSVELGGRVFRPRRGRFLLRVSGEDCEVRVREGSGTLEFGGRVERVGERARWWAGQPHSVENSR